MFEATSTPSQCGHLEAAGDNHLARLIKIIQTLVWKTPKRIDISRVLLVTALNMTLYESSIFWGELYEPPGGKQNNFN